MAARVWLEHWTRLKREAEGQRLDSLGLIPTGIVTVVITASENREVCSPSQILGLVLSRQDQSTRGR